MALGRYLLGDGRAAAARRRLAAGVPAQPSGRSRRAPPVGRWRTSARWCSRPIRRCGWRSSGRTARSAAGASRRATAPCPSPRCASGRRPSTPTRRGARDDRAEALTRFLRATPPELPVDDGGLRYSVVGAERDEAAATLLVRVRVTNPGGEDQALRARPVRASAALDAAPTIDPPAARLGASLVRDLRLRFAGVTDAVAEAAVLVLRPGVELQAYSEDLR